MRLCLVRSISFFTALVGWVGGFQAGVVEGVGFDFALSFVAREWDFLAIQEKAYTGCVSGVDYDLTGGANGGLRGCDQGLFEQGLTVGNDRDPGSFGGADQQRESRRRFCRGGVGGGRIIAGSGRAGGGFAGG